MIRSDFVRKMMSNSVAQGLNFGSRWLLNLALARHMLETEFGLFSFVYMLANLFFPTIAFGVNFYLIHNAAKQRDINSLISSLAISFFVFLLMSVGFFIYSELAQDPLQYLLYWLSLAIGLVWALNQAIFSYLKGAQQFAIEVKSQLLGSVLMLVLVAFVWFGALDDTVTVLSWILVLSLAPLLVGLKVVWPEFSQSPLAAKQRWRQIWQPLLQGNTWRDRASYAWHDVFAIYLTNIPFIFLAIFSSLTALGQFRKAFILFMPVTLLPVVFSQVLLSKLSAKAVLSEKAALFKRIFIVSFPVLSLPYVLLMLLYPWLYPWLLNERLTPDTDMVTLLVVITLWLTLFKTYFEVWITATGRSDWRAANVTLVALLSSLAYLLINDELDSVTAAWVFMLSNLTAVVLLQLVCWRCYRRDKKAAVEELQSHP